MSKQFPDHYATLGLDRRCTSAHIQSAYRNLAAKYHPDRNHQSLSALRKMQQLNEAYETLSDPRRRQIYHRDLDERQPRDGNSRSGKTAVLQDVHLPIRSFFRGTSLEIHVKDPSNPGGTENYRLDVPSETAPGSRFRINRTDNPTGGIVQVRIKPLPHHRFKARGFDLRCDLRLTHDRVQKGGIERFPGPADNMISVTIPPRAARGEIIRIPGEGLPRSRGGRGDLLVRIVYRPEVRISRSGSRA